MAGSAVTVSSTSTNLSVVYLGRNVGPNVGRIDINTGENETPSLTLESWDSREASPVPVTAGHDEVPARDVPGTLKMGQPSGVIFEGQPLEDAASSILEQAGSMEEAGAAVEELNQAIAPAEASAGGERAPDLLRESDRSVQAALKEQGFAVVPTKLVDVEFRRDVLGTLDLEIKNEWTKREFKPGAFDDTDAPMTDDKTRLVGGGFAALGNPSSFHSEVVRMLRRIAHCAMVDAKPFDLIDRYTVSQVIDRLLKRLPGDTPSKESWHRDVGANTKERDKLYGGWINLDSEPQYFSCIPGTHRDAVDEGVGFKTDLSPKDKEKIKFHKERGKPLVEIPPGNMLIFNERLIHEVVGKRATKSMLRLFTGWYVTHHNVPHDSRPEDSTTSGETERDRLRDRLERNACMFLKSGQAPAMVPKLHWTNFPEKIADYTDRLRNVATDLRPRNPTRANPHPNPAAYRCPHRTEVCAKLEKWYTLDSLQTMQSRDRSIELWEPYNPDDVKILFPMTYDEAESIAGKFRSQDDRM